MEWTRRARIGVGGGVAVVAIAVLLVVVLRGRGILDPPAPVVTEDGVWVPELPASTLHVPINYDLTPVMRALEEAVPQAYGSLEERLPTDNERADFAFHVRRDPFLSSLLDDRARISTVLRYQGRAWYDAPVLPEVSASCGSDDEPLRAVVSLSARIWLSEDWQLRSDPRVDHVAPLSEDTRDRCRITPLRIDVTERVITSARTALEDRLPALQSALAEVDLRSRFVRWWDLLLHPIQLSDDVWLVIDPVGVARGETRGMGQQLQARVGLTARPRIVLGEEPQIAHRALPPLDTMTVGEGLHILATATSDYPSASARLTEQLAGREISRQGQTIRVDRVEATGIGSGRLALNIYFSGAARGHLWLVGTPEYDPLSGEVFVPDLTFDVETLDVLIQGLAWLGSEEISDFFREQARWRVDDLSRFAEEQLLNGLNRDLTDEVHIKGDVESVRIMGVYPLRESLVVQAEALATAELVITELDETTATPGG